ncbi:MAG: SAM-dependent methyltransferase [Nanoarchaeota archaeon]
MIVIEHLDPKLWAWSLLEYQHIASVVGKENLLFTNVRTSVAKFKALGAVDSKSITQLDVPRPCILDANAPETLTTVDASKFTHFIFGGVLGDDPPQGRTQKLAREMPTAMLRNLGPIQMTTDTAVIVAWRILHGEKLSNIPFVDEPEIPKTDEESIILPFRYIAEKGKPVFPAGFEKWLIAQKGF